MAAVESRGALFFPHLVHGEEGEVGELGDAPHVRDHEVDELTIFGAGDERKVTDQGGLRQDSVRRAEDLATNEEVLLSTRRKL